MNDPISPIHPVLRVVALRDPLVESAPGATPTASLATLAFWTPIVGPTAALMAFRFARDCTRHDTPAQWRLDVLAATFGVAPAVARRAIDRLAQFGVAARRDDTIAIRLMLPPLPARLRQRLPDHLALEYEAHLARCTQRA